MREIRSFVAVTVQKVWPSMTWVSVRPSPPRHLARMSYYQCIVVLPTLYYYYYYIIINLHSRFDSNGGSVCTTAM